MDDPSRISLPANDDLHGGADPRQREAEHHHDDVDDDDEWLLPDPNFLAQFRAPVSEAEMDEMARALERAIAEVFGEPPDEAP